MKFVAISLLRKDPGWRKLCAPEMAPPPSSRPPGEPSLPCLACWPLPGIPSICHEAGPSSPPVSLFKKGEPRLRPSLSLVTGGCKVRRGLRNGRPWLFARVPGLVLAPVYGYVTI